MSTDPQVGRGVTRRRHVVVVGGCVVLVALVAWWLGTDVGHAVAFGVAAGLVVHLWFVVGGADVSDWQAEMLPAPHGTRDDVSRLGWDLAPGERGTSAARLRRLREVARERLAPHGLDIDAADHAQQVAELLGTRAAGVLARTATRVRAADVEATLAALARLAPHPPPGSVPGRGDDAATASTATSTSTTRRAS